MDREAEGEARLRVPPEREPPERDALGLDARELLLGVNPRLPPLADGTPGREIVPELPPPDRPG